MPDLTDDPVKLVKNNWAVVKPNNETAADLFYDKLFELDPSVRSLFKDDLNIQKKQLMATISFAVANLNHPDKFVPAVQALGKRHSEHGVTPEHYNTVAAALIWTLEKGLGEQWAPEAKETLTDIYGILSSKILYAAKEAA